jgi:hypothetical protein
MGNKSVCLHCRLSFNYGTDFFEAVRKRKCPRCGMEMVNVSYKFRPPPKRDAKRWAVVAYLLEKGFRFHSITGENGETVSYPKTMPEAILFAERFAEKQASGDPPPEWVAEKIAKKVR